MNSFRKCIEMVIDFIATLLPLIRGSSGLSNYNTFRISLIGGGIDLPASNQRISTYIYAYDNETEVFVQFPDNQDKVSMYAKINNYPLKLTNFELGDLVYGRILVTVVNGADAMIIDRIKS